MARRFAQLCLIALSTFATSGAGRLAYVPAEAPPEWLSLLCWGAAATAVFAFSGWALCSLGSLAAQYAFTGAGRN